MHRLPDLTRRQLNLPYNSSDDNVGWKQRCYTGFRIAHAYDFELYRRFFTQSVSLQELGVTSLWFKFKAP